MGSVTSRASWPSGDGTSAAGIDAVRHLPSPARATTLKPDTEEMMTMMWWNGTPMNGWGYASLAFGIAVLCGIAVFVAITLAGRRGFDDNGTLPTPEQILADRFARGEIDEPEYRARLDVLHTGKQPAGP